MLPEVYRYEREEILCQLPLVDYMAEYYDRTRFYEYCTQCPVHMGNWSCPPFDFDVDEMLRSYKWAQIIVHRIVPDTAQWQAVLPKEIYDYSYGMMYAVRDEIDPILREIEQEEPGRLFFTAGRCKECPQEIGGCTRPEGLPCRHPERQRSSLEAWGFDLAGTTERLASIPMVWARDGHPPRYLTMVSALLSSKPVEIHIPPHDSRGKVNN